MKECVVGVLMVECHTGGSEQALVQLLLREWRVRMTPRARLQGGMVTLARGLILARGQKIARFYKQNFTGRLTLQPRTT